MSETELKNNGFIVFKKVHIIVTLTFLIVGFIGTVFAQKAIAENMLADHEKRITAIESENKTNRDLLLELKFNIKSMMEKQGLTYQEVTK
jgi:hypothetical protein